LVQGTKFVIDGNEIYLNGANTPWNYWNEFGSTDGGNYAHGWWNSEFARMKSKGINSVRIWLSDDGVEQPIIDANGYVTGVGAQFWSDLDDLMSIAANQKIYVMLSMMSFDHTDRNKAKHARWRAMFSTQDRVQAMVDNYIVAVVNRYKNNPFLFSIDLCNEPEWIVDPDNSNDQYGRLPLAQVQRYVAMAAAGIHNSGSKTLVTLGTASVKWNSTKYTGNYWSNSALQAQYANNKAFLDFYQLHYYLWMEPYFPLRTSTANLLLTDRPVVMGEMPAKDSNLPTGETMAGLFNFFIGNGYSGHYPWTTNGADVNGNLNDFGNAALAFQRANPGKVFVGQSDVIVYPIPTVATSAPSLALANSTSSINYTVTFYDASSVILLPTDVSLAATGTANCSKQISGSGVGPYTVNLSNCTGNGTMAINIAAGVAWNPIAEPSPMPNTSGLFTIDNSAPVLTIGAASATLAKSSSPAVNYVLTYSGADSVNLNTSKITLNTTGTASCSKAVSGSGLITRTVALTTCTGDGTVGITVVSGTGVDTAGNNSASKTSSTFMVNNSGPIAVISPPSTAKTSSSKVNYIVTYSNANSVSLNSSNISLNKTGTANGSIEVSNCSVLSCIVTISGNGTLGISLAAGTAVDTLGNSSAAVGASTTFIVDSAAPSASISLASNSYTGQSNITYLVNFLNAATVTLSSSTVTLNKSGTANGTVTVSACSTSSCLITISGISGDGTLGVSLPAGSIVAAGGAQSAAVGPSVPFIVDNTRPIVTIGPPSQLTADRTDSIKYEIVHTDLNMGAVALNIGSVSLVSTGLASCTKAISGSGNKYTVTLSSCTGDGTVKILIAAGTGKDLVGNASVETAAATLFTVSDSARIYVQGSKFMLQGTAVYFNGANTPWNKWNEFGSTDGNNYDSTWWSNEFARMKAKGINSVRVWVSHDGVEEVPKLNPDGTVVGPGAKFWSDVDNLMSLAATHKIYLMATMMSFDHTYQYHWNYTTGAHDTTFKAWIKMLSDEAMTQTMVDNYILPFAVRYKDNPYLFSIDLCNEPEWIIDPDQSDWNYGRLPKEYLQRYAAMASAAIHKSSSKVLVTIGSASVKWHSDIYTTNGINGGNYWSDSELQKQYNDKEAYLDFYQLHYYLWMEPYFPLKTATSTYLLTDRPVVMGEMPAKDSKLPAGQTMGGIFEFFYTNGYSGHYPWTSNVLSEDGSLLDFGAASLNFQKAHPATVITP
jgi:hypothetical protein